MGIVYYHHANPSLNSDSNQTTVSPSPFSYDCNKTGFFSDCIYHSRNLNSRFYVVACGYQVGWETANSSDHVCNRYILHFVFRGVEYFNGQKVIPGDVFVTMPNEKHTILCKTKDQCAHGWLSLSGKELEAMIGIHHLPTTPIIHISNDKMKQIEQIFIETIYEKHSDISMPNYLFSRLFQILSIMNIPTSHGTNTNNAHINRALEYISTHYSKNITINDIANAINISVSYLQKLFTKELQQSPQSAITQKRISVAKTLLQNQDMSINLIAEACGFTDQSAFSKRFKQETGHSPSAYRKLKMRNL